ncbi:DUF6456 domain-containing protein [Devosia sediminis]|uniref:DUF6456 domain-containing protein n=1 Tax=Devosia sediminis TaxID=2798801 RepID=A0A934MHJ1_9HYPH|nr:DUF6456 domain-containing protein [Devosia sediminis]MBJ3785147.1 hypothetical protein [Devosia sediminis]
MATPLPDAVRRLDGFLAPHHIEAASRLLNLFERASLRQRVTMSYDPGRVGAARGNAQGELADSAADARRRLAGLASRLPADCWGLLADICLYDKGLQQIEAERGWPRRAAKLVLRIGLEQSAMLFGLAPAAAGRERGAVQSWLPERVPMFAATEQN